MPAPTGPTYSVTAKVYAHTGLLGFIDAGGVAGSLKIRSSTDVLLAQIPLTYPAGTVNGTTGRLTLTPSGRDESADATGTAAYVEICSSAGAVHGAFLAQAGTVAVSGKFVMNTLSIVATRPVEALSMIIG